MSFWNDNLNKKDFAPLKGDISTDVLIIGGGLAGVLCAYFLKQKNINYLLIEKDKIGGGVTENTTAKITAQHGLIYSKIIKEYGLDAARGYLNANLNAIENYSRIAKNIDCDFTRSDAYTYSLNDIAVIKNEVSALKKIGFNAQFVRQTDLPLSILGAIKMENQAQFNPLKFLYGIAENLNIYENTKATEFLDGKVKTSGGIITAKKIIVTTHFPFLNKCGGYPLKLYQHRSYVLALKGAVQPDGMYVDYKKDGLSFRNYGDILLLGGGSHMTGKKGGGFTELERVARLYYPQSKIISRFATQDCMSLDGIPYIGRYGKNTQNLFVATGFNKWGMTSSMVAAEILCDAITQKDNPYSAIFSPQRSILHKQLALNIAHSTMGLLTPTAPRCPHLGCALKYNKQEHTWDCPCHGSRFKKDGRLLNGPATDDLKI